MKTKSPKIIFRLLLSTCLGKHDISLGDGKGRGVGRYNDHFPFSNYFGPETVRNVAGWNTYLLMML